MLDSIYHMTLKLYKTAFSALKGQEFAIFNATSGVSILLHGVISLPDATLCDKPCVSQYCERYQNRK